MFMTATESFSFSEYLDALPADLVFERFVKRLDLPRKIISASMVKEISARFSSEKNLLGIFSELSSEAQYTCSLVYLYGAGGLPAENNLFVLKKENATPLQTRGAFEGFNDELLGSFLVYAGKDSLGTLYYAGFDEFEPILRNTCGHVIEKKCMVQPDKEPVALSPFLCLNDVSVIVALASQGKLQTTKTGGLSKMSTTLVAKLLHGAQTLFTNGCQDISPASISLRYAIQRGLLSDTEALTASHERMLAWLSLPLETRQAEIVEFVLSSYPLWNRAMLDEILPKPGKPWISAKAFGETQRDCAFTNVKMYAYCGFLDFYRSGGDCVFTRSQQKTTVSQQTPRRSVILQADFSAMLPQETSPDDLYWFSKIGNLVLLDTVYRGNIDKGVVCDSLSAGIDGDELLKKMSVWEAPLNVILTVTEWIREFSRVALLTGSIVVSAEEKSTKQLLSYEPLGKCLEPINADCVFRIVNGKEETVSKLLVAMGFDPRPSHTPSPPDPPKEDTDNVLQEPLVSRLTPVVNFDKIDPVVSITVKQGKYGRHLKALELTDLMHVIDYALLMGNRVNIDYAGSPGLRKGAYSIRPLNYKKGERPQLEAQSGNANAKKLFFLEKIVKIGVESGDV